VLKHNDALESGCTSADIRPSAWLQRPLLMIKVTDPIGLQGPLAHARTKLFRRHWTAANAKHLEAARHAADNIVPSATVGEVACLRF